MIPIVECAQQKKVVDWDSERRNQSRFDVKSVFWIGWNVFAHSLMLSQILFSLTFLQCQEQKGRLHCFFSCNRWNVFWVETSREDIKPIGGKQKCCGHWEKIHRFEFFSFTCYADYYTIRFRTIILDSNSAFSVNTLKEYFFLRLGRDILKLKNLS